MTDRTGAFNGHQHVHHHQMPQIQTGHVPPPVNDPYPPRRNDNMDPKEKTLKPSWSGFIHTGYDALLVLEAVLSGRIQHVRRRPHDRERNEVIKSGAVFVYEESSSGIKRWTDGVSWSPSRIMGNFLVYRELQEPFPAGEKKKAKKRKATEISKAPQSPSNCNEEDRKLVGSLIDSYGFKPNGLIKKTINVKYGGVGHHIVSYYNLEAVKKGHHFRPKHDPRIADLHPRAELMENQFKVPIVVSEEDYYTSPVDPWSTSDMSVPFMPRTRLIPVSRLTRPIVPSIEQDATSVDESGVGFLPHPGLTPSTHTSSSSANSTPVDKQGQLFPLPTPYLRGAGMESGAVDSMSSQMVNDYLRNNRFDSVLHGQNMQGQSLFKNDPMDVADMSQFPLAGQVPVSAPMLTRTISHHTGGIPMLDSLNEFEQSQPNESNNGGAVQYPTFYTPTQGSIPQLQRRQTTQGIASRLQYPHTPSIPGFSGALNIDWLPENASSHNNFFPQ